MEKQKGFLWIPDRAEEELVEWYRASDVDARIAELEQVRDAAMRYYQNWMVDEAEDRSVCLSDEQHDAARGLRDALSACGLLL